MDDTQYIWLLTQGDNDGYDSFDSCVVVAATEDRARRIHPDDEVDRWTDENGGRWVDVDGDIAGSGAWARPDQVKATMVGTSIGGVPGTVICSSFNAG